MAMAQAVRVTFQSSEIGDVSLLPKKGMKARVAGGVGSTHNLAVIVQAGRKNTKRFSVSAEVAQVSRLTVLPQNSVKRREIVPLNRIERPAGPGAAHNLAQVIDRECDPVRVAGNGGQLSCTSEPDLVQMTGLNSMICGDTDAPGQVESISPFSAVPAAMPKSLIFIAAPLLPSLPELLRSLGSATMVPFCQTNGAQV